VTICSRKRRPIFANNTAFNLIIGAWRDAGFWHIGRFVIMPDHLHFFCTPGVFPPTPLRNWISFWQNAVTRAWAHRQDLPLWQRDFWDRQLRRGESYAEKWEYVLNNPVRHGFVKRPDDWPYQGELNVLDWHDT
jgi:putative transposase